MWHKRPLLIIFCIFCLSRGYSQEKVVHHIISCKTSDCDSLKAFIENYPHVTAEDYTGHTLMHLFTISHYACYEETIALLIQKGVSINARDHRAETPLDCAMMAKDYEKIIILLRLGGEMGEGRHYSGELKNAVTKKDEGEIIRICKQLLNPVIPYDYHYFNTILYCASANYVQGKYGFAGGAFAVKFASVGYILESHVGAQVGIDAGINNHVKMVPKLSVDYRYLIFMTRAGLAFPTDFSRTATIPFAEAGLTFFGFADLTYQYQFASGRNDIFNLGHNFVNLTVNVPFNSKDR